MFNKVLLTIGALLASVGVVESAFAVGADYSAITASADWSTAAIALGVVAGALAIFLVYKKGVRGVLSMFGR